MKMNKPWLVCSLIFINSFIASASNNYLQFPKDSISIRVSPLFSFISFSSNQTSSYSYPTKLGISIESIYSLKQLNYGKINILAGLDINRYKAVSGSTFIVSYNATYLNIGSLLEKKINKNLTINSGLILGVGLFGKQKFASGNSNSIFAKNALLRTNLSLGIMPKYILKENISLFADFRLGLLNIENNGDKTSKGEKSKLHTVRFGIEVPFTFIMKSKNKLPKKYKK